MSLSNMNIVLHSFAKMYNLKVFEQQMLSLENKQKNIQNITILLIKKMHF